MTLSDDITERAAATFYRLWTKVNRGFIQSAAVRTNQLWQRIQTQPVVDHYPVQLGANGTPPATFFGSAGAVEAAEALAIVEWYDQQTGNNTDAWLLTLEGELVWTKGAGIEPASAARFTDYVTDFLSQVTPPNLLPIQFAPPVLALSYLLAADADADEVRARWQAAASGPGNKMEVPLSSSGEPPATHWAGAGVFQLGDLAAITKAFPIKPGDPTDVLLLRLADQVPFWSNDTGAILPGPPAAFADFLTDQNLAPVR